MRRTIAALTVAAALPAGSAHAETAKPVQQFSDSVGVNTHMTYPNTPYGQSPSIIRDRLLELGVRHVRDGVCGTCEAATAAQVALGQAGVRFNFQIGQGIGRNASTVTVNDKLDTIISKGLLPYTETVEGINEPDLQQDDDWRAKTIEQQQQIRQRISSDPRLAGLKVLGASAGKFENISKFAALSDLADFGNIHPYPGGHPPENALDVNLPPANAAWSGKPLMLTETGYHNATNGFWSPHKPTSLQVAAAYYPRLYLENFRRGIPRTFGYELADNWYDALNINQEASFGLLRNNLTRKPAFNSLANLMKLLSDQGPSIAGDLDVNVEGSGVNHLLLSHSDGSFSLAVWNTNSIWRPENTWPVPDQPRPVTVKLPQTMSVSVHRPMQGVDSIQSAERDQVALTVPADPLIVRLRPTSGSTQEQQPTQEQPTEPTQEQPTEPTTDPDTAEPGEQASDTVVRVRVVNPTSGRRYRIAPLVLVSARAEGSKVREVRFFVDGRKFATDRSAPYAVRLPGKLPFGKHTVKAVAVAVDDTEATSQTVTVTRVR